jgi:hypothetical protein
MPLFRVVLLSGLVLGLTVFAVAGPRPQGDPAAAALRERLKALVLRTVVLSPTEIVATIRSGLESSSEREMALAAMQARIAAPWMVANLANQDEARGAWTAELNALTALRPQVETLLADSSSNIRVRTVAMLVALQMDPATFMPVLDQNTERLLIQQFAKDPSESVRAKIVGLFRDVTPPLSPDVRRLLQAALTDRAARIRASALDASVEQVTHTEAASLLMRMLPDPDQQIRVQTALLLLRFQDALTPHVAALKAALARETDAKAQQYLQLVLEQVK